MEIQLWSINDSAMAPKFEIIESPNNWSRTTKESSSTSGGAAVQIKYNFWSAFNDYVYGEDAAPAFSKLFHMHKPSSDHWYTLNIGITKIHMSLLVNTKTNVISVEVYIDTPNLDKTVYDNLYSQHKSEIEGKLGYVLDWRRLDNKQCSRILLENSEFNILDQTQRNKQYDWLTSKAVEIRKAFLPYIK